MTPDILTPPKVVLEGDVKKVVLKGDVNTDITNNILT